MLGYLFEPFDIHSSSFQRIRVAQRGSSGVVPDVSPVPSCVTASLTVLTRWMRPTVPSAIQPLA